MTDTIADTIIRIKNGYSARKETVVVRYSKMIEKIIALLTLEKYIKSYLVVSPASGGSHIMIKLLYLQGKPAVKGVQIISKTGRRMYGRTKDLKPVLGGLGIAVLSTSKGIMTGKQARKDKSGGEILFKLW